jgi:hypothetical protein
VVKSIGLYPRVRADTAGTCVVSQAGGVALVETVRVAGLDTGLSQALGRWRKPMARHDPAKVITDLAVTLALGGDCLADIALLRAEPAVFGAVASDPTVSRTIDALAADVPAALKAIDAARAKARAVVWSVAGEQAPDHDAGVQAPMVIDLDATLITAHSEKELAAPTYKRGFGFHPLWSFVDHGADGSGEPLSCLLRKGNAGSNTAADHITLAQLPGHRPGTRVGRKVLIRTDGAGSTHEFLNWLTNQRLSYSVGFALPTDFTATVNAMPADGWTPAYDGDGQPRDGAWLADVTGLMNLTRWPKGMRVIVRKERPHPGAQLRITDAGGHRITAFATNTVRGQLADLELRHRQRARCEDRIRNSKDTGLANLPLHDFAQNQIYCAIVALAVELTAWMQMLSLAGHQARRWEPKRLRLRLFSIAARIARHGRTRRLHLSAHAPWTPLLADMIDTLQAIPAPR